MSRRTLVSALVAGMVLGAAAVPAVALPVAPAPLGLPETNPIGTMKWLPVDANERPTGGSVYRLVVVYDHSLDPDTGEPTDLLASGPWGMKLFSNSVAGWNLEVPAIELRNHSSHVSSLDDAGLPPELQQVDEAFIGLSGDVSDADCDDAGTSAFSAAYSTTRSFFHAGSDPYAAATGPGVCEVVDSSIAVEDDDGNVIGFTTTVTNHVPGFWFDVYWPYEIDPAAAEQGNGHTLSEIWYGALPGFGSTNPTDYEEAASTGLSPTLRGPGDYIQRYTLFDDAPNPAFPCNGSGHTVQFTVPEVPDKANAIRVDLYPIGDWDLQIDEATSGNFSVNESVILDSFNEGDVLNIEGCNFAGANEAELIVSWI